MEIAPRNRSRVLIVDDEEAILTALQLAFQDEDWHIEVATAAQIAYQRFTEAPFDLVLVDKNLPEMDGVELIRRIRCDNDKVRFVMITGYASLESAVETANLGIDAYLEKPFRDVFAIARTVREVLGRTKPSVAARLSQMFARKSADPREATAARGSGSVQSDKAHSRQPKQTAASSSMDMTVLIASAEQRTHKQITAQIGAHKSRVFYAQSSQQILTSLETDKPDAVIVHGALDLVALVERIRSVDAETAIMIVSESLDLESLEQLMVLGVNAVVDKPIDSEAFQARLEQLLKALGTKLRTSDRTGVGS